MMTLSDVASCLKLSCTKDVAITGVSIDSRRLVPGDLFVAISGENFDGHQFIHQAASLGAVAAIVKHKMPDVPIPQLVVSDTLVALATLAAHHRQQLDCKVIALTGSNGKTTVKEMISHILPQPSFATPGNLNNHIGAPMSALLLNSKHRYAVFELGANHQGEIAHTVAIVKPQVALINNIAPAHIGEFGSIDGVAHAKGEIYQGLGASGIAVINDDDAYAHFWDPLIADKIASKNIIRFSAVKPTTVHARDISFNAHGCACFTLVMPNGDVFIQLAVPGAHNVSNALAAAACTYALGLSLSDIAAGLSRFTGVPGRMAFLHGRNHSLIIDDTYNANLRSVMAGIDVLSAREGRRIFVFGDMMELGEWSDQHHIEVGNMARTKGIDMLMTIGSHSHVTTQAFGASAKHYDNQDALAHDLLSHLDAQTTVLVKGSRSSRMENIVRQLI